MPNSLQDFLATSAQKAATDLETALRRLPEEKRNWSPMGSARSALDMVAECAILNGNTATTIENRAFPADFDFADYYGAKAQLALDEGATLALLHQSTARVVGVIQQVSDADLAIEVPMPWRPMTLTQIISYPYWNMSYHEGQINYLASMLDCLP